MISRIKNPYVRRVVLVVAVPVLLPLQVLLTAGLAVIEECRYLPSVYRSAWSGQ